MAEVTPKYTYRKKSLYKTAYTFGEDRKNLGFDYTKKIMEKSLSPYIHRNPMMSAFVTYLNDYVVNLITAIKKFKMRRIYTVDKDYQHID